MTIDTKNLRVLAEAGKATGFDLVDMNEHDFAACQKAKRELRTAMTPTAVVELLDALERKDLLLKQALDAMNYHADQTRMTAKTALAIINLTKEIGA